MPGLMKYVNIWLHIFPPRLFVYLSHCKSIIDRIFKQLTPGKINGHNTINKHWIYWLLVFWCDVSLVISCCPTSITAVFKQHIVFNQAVRGN